MYQRLFAKSVTNSGFSIDFDKPSSNLYLDPEVIIEYDLEITDDNEAKVQDEYLVAQFRKLNVNDPEQIASTDRKFAPRDGFIFTRAIRRMDIILDSTERIITYPLSAIDVTNKIYVSKEEMKNNGTDYDEGVKIPIIYNYIDEGLADFIVANGDDVFLSSILTNNDFIPALWTNNTTDELYYPLRHYHADDNFNNPAFYSRNTKFFHEIRTQEDPNSNDYQNIIDFPVSIKRTERIYAYPFKFYSQHDDNTLKYERYEINATFYEDLTHALFTYSQESDVGHSQGYQLTFNFISIKFHLRWLAKIPPPLLNTPKYHIQNKPFQIVPVPDASPFNEGDIQFLFPLLHKPIMMSFCVKKRNIHLGYRENTLMCLEMTNFSFDMRGKKQIQNIETPYIYKLFNKNKLMIEHNDYNLWRKYNCMLLVKQDDILDEFIEGSECQVNIKYRNWWNLPGGFAYPASLNFTSNQIIPLEFATEYELQIITFY